MDPACSQGVFARSAGRRRPVRPPSSPLSHPTCLGLVIATLLFPAIRGEASAQAVREPDAKAAFLFNVARFTEWPGAQPPAGSIVICTTDRGVADALETTVSGRLAGGRPVTARRVRFDDANRDCGILYLAGIDRREAVRAITSVVETPVLTVSDQAGFVSWGGGIEIVIERGRLAFLVNRMAAERQGLRLSSRLLGLARPPRD